MGWGGRRGESALARGRRDPDGGRRLRGDRGGEGKHHGEDGPPLTQLQQIPVPEGRLLHLLAVQEEAVRAPEIPYPPDLPLRHRFGVDAAHV